MATASKPVQYRVAFAPEAEAQLLSLYRYIASEAGPDIANGYVTVIVEHCEKLETFPLRGTLREDIRPGLRTVPFRRRVTIAYSVIKDRVVVLEAYYGGQDFETLLEGMGQANGHHSTAVFYSCFLQRLKLLIYKETSFPSIKDS